MTDPKKYIWLIPLIGGIIAIVATIATPAVSMVFMGMARDSLWMWGFYTLDAGPDSITHFIPNIAISITSLVVTALIVVSGILLILFAVLSRKGTKLRRVRNISIITGILILAGEILWLIIVPANFPFEQYSFWSGYPGTFWKLCYGVVCFNMHNVGFGIIGGFLAAGLAFLGVGLATYYSKERPEKVIQAKEPVLPSEEKGTVTKTELLFCSECGTKI
ncbi:MAG: hypothetical protein ACFFBT_14215, partial [Promethearchaeota archaeon]